MKPVLEEKLRELIDEAELQGAAAMYAVLQLLLGSHLSGQQNNFAQHCCQFAPVKILGVTATVTDGRDDSLTDSGRYYH